MSGEVLNPDQIAALVAAAKDGQLPDEPKRSSAGRQRRLRTVDFTRPTKFTSDQERRLRRSLDTFCRTASTRLSAELRVPIELEVISSSQLTWGNSHGPLPQTTLCGVVGLRPMDTRMLLAFELPLVLGLLDCLAGGGTSAQGTRERKLTEIDRTLADYIFTTLLKQLEVTWKDITEIELELIQLEAPMETASVAPVSEPTMSFTFEVRLGRQSYTMSLLIPFRAIQPVEEAFADSDDGGPDTDDPSVGAAVTKALGNVEVTVRGEVAGIDMSVEEVLALKPGDVVRLAARAEDGVTLFADAVPVHAARPGRSGNRRALQILGPAPGSP